MKQLGLSSIFSGIGGGISNVFGNKGVLAALLAVGAFALIVSFRSQISDTFSKLGSGFQSFGTGISAGTSALLSPQITPLIYPQIGLGLGIGGLNLPSSNNTSGTPSGQTGGFSGLQSAAETSSQSGGWQLIGSNVTQYGPPPVGQGYSYV